MVVETTGIIEDLLLPRSSDLIVQSTLTTLTVAAYFQRLTSP